MVDNSHPKDPMSEELPNIGETPPPPPKQPKGAGIKRGDAKEPGANGPILKYGLIGGGVLILVIVLMMFMGGDKPEEELPIGFSTSVEDDALAEIAASQKQFGTAAQAESAMALINDRLLRLEEKIDQVSTNVRSQIELLVRQNQEQDQKMANMTQGSISVDDKSIEQIKQQLATLSAASVEIKSFEALVERVQKIESMRQQQAAQAKVQAQKKATQEKTTIPFNLVSVDIWNGRRYAAVSINGKVSLLSRGHYLMGWRVEAIDYANQTVEFVNKHGKHVTKSAMR